ncbi:hypothetical protein FVEG_05802 [Fusarium verticillioides 7600]|uniref:Uncharacterized protein n=1 Tax=Gibberella moniliformis (strain M3125 / FGSC 7600) TaxID=334819 RepID=W7MIV3_GIBM7|nr:hypothetical protein FVEG_05802 [Fusarium verticillioides 7600]EWG44817.1 hypothetical protein FVEG_05802 [Fusarium verticillioides 7600]
MSSTNAPRISPALHEAALAVFEMTEHNRRAQQSQLDEALDIKQVFDSLYQNIDELEVMTMHLHGVPGAESYFKQAQQHIQSFRLIRNNLKNTVASITDADVKHAQEMRFGYAQFLSHISCYTGDDTQALASLENIIWKFDEDFHPKQRQRLATIRDQLDSFILLLNKMAALKHALEEQGLI